MIDEVYRYLGQETELDVHSLSDALHKCIPEIPLECTQAAVYTEYLASMPRWAQQHILGDGEDGDEAVFDYFDKESMLAAVDSIEKEMPRRWLTDIGIEAVRVSELHQKKLIFNPNKSGEVIGVLNRALGSLSRLNGPTAIPEEFMQTKEWLIWLSSRFSTYHGAESHISVDGLRGLSRAFYRSIEMIYRKNNKPTSRFFIFGRRPNWENDVIEYIAGVDLVMNNAIVDSWEQKILPGEFFD